MISNKIINDLNCIRSAVKNEILKIHVQRIYIKIKRIIHFQIMETKFPF